MLTALNVDALWAGMVFWMFGMTQKWDVLFVDIQFVGTV